MKKRSPVQEIILSSFLLISFMSQAQDYEVYVSSRGENAVKKYSAYGDYLGYFVAPGTGGLNGTEDILFHPDGSVLVTGFGNTTIKRYDGETGAFLGDFSSGYALATPSKMSIGPDSLIYVTQWDAVQNNIVRFDLDGNFVDEFTTEGAPNGLGHLWDADGNFYVALFGTGADGVVRKFDADGNDLGDFINSGVLQGPTSIWVNAEGHMFVEDWSVGTVLEYSSSGSYLGVFNSGSMNNPEGIAMTPDGLLLIGDWGQDVVHILDTLGNHLGIFAAGEGLSDPNSVKIRMIDTPDTTVHVTDLPVSTWEVLPNIGSGPFTLQLHGSFSFLYVYDEQGTMVDQLNVQGKQSFQWEPADLPAGMYLLVCSTSDGLQATRKILLQK